MARYAFTFSLRFHLWPLYPMEHQHVFSLEIKVIAPPNHVKVGAPTTTRGLLHLGSGDLEVQLSRKRPDLRLCRKKLPNRRS